jgi:hypothetical protein
VRAVFHLPLRQAEGFLRLVAALLGLALPIPDHTTLSRPGRALGKIALGGLYGTGPLHILINCRMVQRQRNPGVIALTGVSGADAR